MNRYAALGIALDASDGKRILVITPRADAIPHAMAEFAELPDAVLTGSRFRRHNGGHRIDFPCRGAIIFRSAGGTVRGYTADVVFLDEGADARLTLDQHAELTLTLATTPQGQIIRA
jgi:hypothetical protein